MIVKLLTEHHLEVLRLKGGCTSSSESTLVIMPHCWKSLFVAQFCIISCLEIMGPTLKIQPLQHWESVNIFNRLQETKHVFLNLIMSDRFK